MSQNHSACIPPPSDYNPRSRPPQSDRKYPERGSQSGRRKTQKRPGRQHSMTFHKDQPSSEDSDNKPKHQPIDKFHRNELDDYFSHVQDEEDDVGEDPDRIDDNDEKPRDEDDDEDDPLDAYMKSIEEGKVGNRSDQGLKQFSDERDPSQSSQDGTEDILPSTTHDFDRKAVRLDIDGNEDIEESYYQYVEESMAKKPPGGVNYHQESIDDLEDKQSLVDYDRDGNVISVRKTKKEIDPLAALDHSTIHYEPFEKIFYQEHEDIKKLLPEQEQALREKLEIKVSGDSPSKPVCSFAHFKFDERLMKVIRRSEYTQPTPIQSQAIPVALMGRNIIGIAMTGSGKTAAYLWPMIVHVMGQPDLKRGDGPIALVLVPTRELALQVYSEAKKFSNSFKIAVVCAYGGGSKYEQSKDLESGAEIVVATPGRMIDLIKLGVTNLRRVTYLVLDEADRFFEMGFEVQVRSICDHIRPDRQTLLFSATFKEKIEMLARTVTDNPIKIVQKALGESNEDVNQHIVVLPAEQKKWDWLTNRLVEFTSAGSVLIFVTRIINSEELHKSLEESGRETLLLHGDMEQSERNRVITLFKRKEKDIMIATDVAARGLDIAHVRTVINYDVARDIDTHIHRVGRTGRAGLKGDAYTLITEKDREFAGHLVKNLESSNQEVNEDIMKLAMQSHNFRKQRFSKNHKSHKHHHVRGSSSHSGGANDDNYRQHHHLSYKDHYTSSHTSSYRRPQDASGPSGRYEDRNSPNRNNNRSDTSIDNKRPRWH